MVKTLVKILKEFFAKVELLSSATFFRLGIKVKTNVFENWILLYILVCGNTMCVSTCYVDNVLLRTVLLYVLLPRSRFSEFGRFLSSGTHCPAFEVFNTSVRNFLVEFVWRKRTMRF